MPYGVGEGDFVWVRTRANLRACAFTSFVSLAVVGCDTVSRYVTERKRARLNFVCVWLLAREHPELGPCICIVSRL